MIELFLKSKVKQALNLLSATGMKDAVIYAPGICVALIYSHSVIWIKDGGIRVNELSKKEFDFCEAELDALVYLFKVREYARFLDAIREWNDANPR